MATITTEHFTLAGARSQTVSEANGRASIFLGAMSSGLVALGFLGPSGTTFEVFALVLLPALAFLGLVTFDRVLQLSVEDIGYGRRIELCRQFYADAWPMLAPYLYRPRAEEGAGPVHRDRGGWQLLLTVSGVLAVLTSLLLGAVVALLSRILLDAAIGVAFAVGGLVAGGALGLLHRAQRTTFQRADFSRIDPQMHRREEDAARARRRLRRDPPSEPH